MSQFRWSVPLVALLASLALVGAPTRLSADDAVISKDWKDSVKKNASRAFAKERAEYWEKKGVTGKDTFWIGFMWEKAGEHAKAIAAFEAYAKLPDALDANREKALQMIMESYEQMKDLEKATAAGEVLIKAYPGSKNLAGFYRQVARIYRQHGKDDKALAYLNQGAEGKDSQAVFDLVDLHLLAGDVAKAKATCDQGLQLLDRASSKEALNDLKALVEKVGQPVPPLEGVKLVTGGDAPTAWGPKPTLLVYTPLMMQGIEGNLRTLGQLRKAWAEGAEVFGALTPMHFDPFTKKEDPTLTEEKEAQMIEEVLAKESEGAAVLLFPKAAFDALGMRTIGQKLLIDAEGKLRWVRVTHQGFYDWYCAEQALKKFAGG